MHSLYALGARFVYIRTRSITAHSPARSPNDTFRGYETVT